MADRAVVAANDATQQAEEAEIPVVVAVHVRPLIHDEVVTGCKPCLSVSDREPQVFCGHHTFNFDQVYGGGGQSPSRLYRDCVEPLVQGIFNGYNATVLAYGQTGSGKTYTMGSHFSPPEKPKGVIPDVLGSMFSRIFSETETEFSLRVGFIEIHKEEIHDLLLEGNEQQPSISLREMPNGSMCIAGAREIEVDLSAGASKSLEFVMSILLRGSMSRATSMTMMNARSSRSHAVFSLMLEQRKGGATSAAGESQDDDGEGSAGEAKETDLSYLCAKMLLVDLAGSERAKRTQATGARLQEGIHINQGLLSLANVIQALVDGHKHVPYRNSKLTRLLQDSLGHNSRTVMVACVSPADSNMEETINTLRYANRARNIKNKPIVNRDPTAAEIVLLRQQLAAARAEIDVLRQQIRGSGLLIGDHSGAVAPRQSGTDSHSAAISEALGEAASNKQLAEALAHQEAAKLAAAGGGSTGDEVLEQIRTYQERIIELESQVAMQAKAIKAQIDTPNGKVSAASSRPVSAAHEAAVAAGHPSVTPFNPSSSTTATASIASPKRPPLVLNKDNPAEAALSRKLSALTVDLQRKQDQINSLNDRKAGGMRQQYDKLVADLLKQQEMLKGKHAELHKKLEESNQNHTAEKIKQSKTYKRQVKELNEQISLMKRREHDKARLEGLMKKSEDMVHRLRNDVNRIKNQKSSLERQIQDLQSDYDTFKKGKAREITDLKKDSQRQESKMRRLAMLNQKQKSVLQRKIQEAEDAKKRLAALKLRAAKRTAATAGAGAATGTGKLPSGSISSLSGSVSRTGSTPIAAITASGAAGHDNSSAAKVGNPLAGDSDSGAVPGAAAPRDVSENGTAGASASAMSAGGLPPLAPDGSVTDPRAFNEWIKEEIESVSTAHYTRQVLDGIVAKRSDLSKSVMEHERKIAEIDHLPEDQRNQQAATRAGLVASKDVIEKEMEACHENIMALHADLDAAGKQNDEARQDASAARFAAIKDVSHAKSLLAALFQTACKFNDEVQRTKAEITDLEDANEILKGRTSAAQEENEERRTELEEIRAAIAAAESNAAESAALLAQSEAARKQMEERVAELEGMATSSHHGRSSASNSPSPERSGGSSSSRPGRRRSGRSSGPRRTETSTGGVVGTFDEASPRDSLETLGARAGGMPPIQEESGDAKAGPDNDALDAQFQNLMNEINMNLGSASRGQTPEPGPRSGSSASGREGSIGGVRSSDDHEAGASRSDQRFRANPAHLFHPREAAAGSSTSTSASADASTGSEPFPRRRQRMAAPSAGPIAAGGDGSGATAAAHRASWDRLPEGRSRGDDPPPGAQVGGGGRPGVPPPPLPDTAFLQPHTPSTVHHSNETLRKAALPHTTTDAPASSPQHAHTKSWSRGSPRMHGEHASGPYANFNPPDSPYTVLPPPPEEAELRAAAQQPFRSNSPAFGTDCLPTDNSRVQHFEAQHGSANAPQTVQRSRRMTVPNAHPDSWTTNMVSELSPRHSDTVASSSSRRHWWSQAPEQTIAANASSQTTTAPVGGRTHTGASPLLLNRNILNAAFKTAAGAGNERMHAAPASRQRQRSNGGNASSDNSGSTHSTEAQHAERATHTPAQPSNSPFDADESAFPSPSIVTTRGATLAAEDEDSSYSPIAESARSRMPDSPPDPRRNSLGWQQQRGRKSRPSTAPTGPDTSHSRTGSASEIQPSHPSPWDVTRLMGSAFSPKPSWGNRGRSSGAEQDIVSNDDHTPALPSNPPGGPVKGGSAQRHAHTAPPSPNLQGGGGRGDATSADASTEAPRVFVSRVRGVPSAAVSVSSYSIDPPASLSGSGSNRSNGRGSGAAGGGATSPVPRSTGWIPPGAGRM